jgi:hypothetical protein
MSTPNPTLYLRTDCSVMMARGDVTIELRLTPAQVLQLGMDCLQVACAHAPANLQRVADALASTDVPAALLDDARQAVAVSTVTADAPCLLN